MKIKCECGKIATWYYMPGEYERAYCDDCVPRGCSCEDLDEKGRKYPCYGWWYKKEGWDDENKN